MEHRKTLSTPALTLVVLALALLVGAVLVTSEATAGRKLAAIPLPDPLGHDPTILPHETLVAVTTSGPLTLDPHWMYDTASSAVAAQVYEGLLMHEREEPAAYIPLLATAWDITSDGRTYTFTIRSDVTFHEGGTLQPHDVAYSFWRGLLQDRASGPMWMLLWPLLDVYSVDDIPGDDVAKCQAVKSAVTFDEDSGSATFHLTNTFAPFIDVLATSVGSVLDQEWMAAHGGWGGDCADWRDYHDPPPEDSILYDQMNGTGPFRFVEWTAGDVHLDRYDGYWRQEPAWQRGPSGPAALETVLLQAEADWPTRRDMLISGEADTVYVPGTNVEELDPYVWGVYNGPEDRDPTLLNPDTGILRLTKDLPSQSQTPLLFCYGIEPDDNPYIGSGALDGDGIPPDFFSDIHVRKAFNLAIDWSEIISDAYHGEAIRSRGPIPSGMVGYTETQPVYPYSPTLSAEEFQLAAGGQVWTQGFSLTVAYNEGNLSRRTILETLAQDLAGINPAFRMQVISLPWDDLLAAVQARRIPVHVGGWLEDYHHPHDWVQPFLHSEGSFGWYQGFPPEMAASFDAKVDECIELVDPAAAQACYEELQDMSYQAAAAAWGVQPIVRHYESTEVRGYYYNPARPTYYYALSKGPSPSVASVDPTEPSTLVFTHTSGAMTLLHLPTGAVSETSVVVFTPDIAIGETSLGGYNLGGLTLDLQLCQSGDCLPDYAFAVPISLRFRYTDADVAGLNEEELYVYTWDGEGWVDAVADCGWPPGAYVRDPHQNRLSLPLCHFTPFALVGTTAGSPMFVQLIHLVPLQPQPGLRLILGLVRIIDETSTPVAGATVDLEWTIPFTYTIPQTKVTNTNGLALGVMLGNWSGTYQLCVTDVTVEGYLYDPDQNLETCDTITLP